jgi:predicted lipid-binding transport protein (Tim44 family)
MNSVFKNLTVMALCWAAPGMLAAQQASPPAAVPAAPSDKPATATAQSEAGEPRATTSSAPPAAVPAAPAAPSRAPTASRPAGAGAGAKPAGTADRLDLGTATVTGSQEQPKVMYIVPWKRSDIGDLAGKPMNSLVDEILAPVDREVFKREVVYYQAVHTDATQNGASPKPSPQGEK